MPNIDAAKRSQQEREIREQFCDTLIGYATAVHAAIIAFAAAIGYTYFVKEFNPAHATGMDYLGWIAVCVAALAYVLDDWFGSRRLIIRLKKRLNLGRRLAQARFTVDLFIAVAAYPIMMAAVRGSRSIGVFLAISLALGAIWSWLCILKEERTRGPEMDVLDEMMGVIVSHALGAMTVMSYFYWQYGPDPETWFGTLGDPIKAAILLLGALALYRFAFPSMWRWVLGRKTQGGTNC